MPASLLESQLKTLEEPAPDEHPIVIRVDGPMAGSVTAALGAIDLVQAVGGGVA
jgi:gluconate kinase